MKTFDTLSGIIHSRRSAKPAAMNGKKIATPIIGQLLELADWAPTHGRTEPWRFVVYGNSAVQAFCAEHAGLYKSNTSEDKFTAGKYDKLLHMGDLLSHIIIAYMKRTEGNSIPVLEEIAAVSAGIENILLGAAALDIAVLWSTGGMIHHPAMKMHLGLAENDIVMGALYLGYTNEPPTPGKRSIPLEHKIVWKS